MSVLVYCITHILQNDLHKFSFATLLSIDVDTATSILPFCRVKYVPCRTGENAI